MPTADKKLQCVVVTPERTVVDEPAEFVALPLYDGELGVLPGRAPLIARLGYGELRVWRDSRVDRYYVDGGFVQIQQNVVSVLTPRALPAEQLDANVTAEQLQGVLTQVPTSEDAFAAKEKALAQARAQLAVARRHERQEQA